VPVGTWVVTTLALRTGSPEVSNTVPAMLELVTSWPESEDVINKSRKKEERKCRIIFISVSRMVVGLIKKRQKRPRSYAGPFYQKGRI
jgi:hypothetical protein